MSGSDILTTLNVLVKLVSEIQNRLDSEHQAAEDLRLLNSNLCLLEKVFRNPVNGDILNSKEPEFVNIPNVLISVEQTCKKIAKALDIELAGQTTVSGNTGAKKLFQRIRVFHKIPDILAEIKRKAEQLEKVYSAVSLTILNDVRAQSQRERSSGKQDTESTVIVKKKPLQENMSDLDLSTGFASIDQMVGNLIRECEHLNQRLQEATLFPDMSAIIDYQTQNPEGASFWKDRFQKDELSASALRYEVLCVSWARFIREVETSFTLKRIPTGIPETGDVDLFRKKGSRYGINQSGTRRLSTVRPLWLPALRSALDPLHKGYVKPQEYFNLLRDCSLSETLRRLVLESAGYGTLIECERSSGDLALPAAIESPSDHIGWISTQIVAVPTPDELGIATEREVMESSGDRLFAYFNDTTQDVHIYVRYLQTGQIERKSLSKQVRPIGGISIGALLSIRHELESGGHAWSCDLYITEYKALYGGRYIVTARGDLASVVFFTRPLKNTFDEMLHDDDDNSSNSAIQEFDCTLLGPSKVFNNPPKVGEKVQIEYDGLWYDSKVTMVDGDEIEFIDWESLPEQNPASTEEAQDDSNWDAEDSGSFFFSKEQLTQLGKGTRRVWRPWQKNIRRYEVRPYRCFHIGDSVEAPVMYPDFRYHYHITSNSQLYLPARIVDVHGDRYVIEFSPALSVHAWWPGRMPKGEKVKLVPGSNEEVENPFNFNRLTVDMDLVRPFSAGPRPILGVQSAKPSGWSSFQGVHFRRLENLWDRILWGDGGVSQQIGGQRDRSLFVNAE